ncbi:hypothetical protein PUN28_004280 [Cardiocondyla obscurior]|uniref:Uncharacterized protein n=1 Tax=Cardiocondyla obscurior TaxID=286306 RepID=A0AAW2GBW5_9HYME
MPLRNAKEIISYACTRNCHSLFFSSKSHLLGRAKRKLIFFNCYKWK